jgi:replicative DNA helicase
VGVALSPADYGPHVRLNDKEGRHAAGITGFWVDIDVKGEAHKKANLPETIDQARELARSPGVLPTKEIDTGHGIQVYWELAKPWIFQDDADREKAAVLVRRFQELLQKNAKSKGREIDSTHDLARVFRLPGTFNCKTGDPVAVRVLASEGPRYELGDFLALAPPEGPQGAAFNGRASDGITVIERARRYVEKMPEGISGQHGHDATFAAAQVIFRGFALSEAEGRPILEEYNQRCQPPWSEKELDHKIRSAIEKSRLPKGYLLSGDGGHAPHGSGTKRSSESSAPTEPVWTAPIPFNATSDLPLFPTHLLPAALREWVSAEAEATQTPPDLAALLALAICGAALATRFRIKVRDGWAEPTNVFTVVGLPPGDRKSAVVTDAMAPALRFEEEEQARMAPLIAEAASEHRMLEAQLKIAEQQAAKATDSAAAAKLRQEAKELARQLAKHVVPELPRTFCDDETPESLGRLIALQGGRMLQASAEGTAFEIVKGRYSEAANFDVYLKGHSGDPLRVGRVGRERDVVDQPALSVALAVQPDVIQGLAEQASLRGRGFLARFLYGVPVSRVGTRTIAPRPVPRRTEAAYRKMVLKLWKLSGAVDGNGKPAPNWLSFSPAADRRMQDFERWIEPQMAEGEDLSLLSGWAQKLAGAAARIAGILHVAAAEAENRPWSTPISKETVEAAVTLARDYLLPHAQAAFALMGADARAANARHVWASIARQSESAECSENGVRVVSRRDIHQWNRRRFPNVEELDPVLALLVDRYYLRPVEGAGQAGRGHASPRYQVNPMALAAFSETDPRTHCSHCTHSDVGTPPSECSENSEYASREEASENVVVSDNGEEAEWVG